MLDTLWFGSLRFVNAHHKMLCFIAVDQKEQSWANYVDVHMNSIKFFRLFSSLRRCYKECCMLWNGSRNEMILLFDVRRQFHKLYELKCYNVAKLSGYKEQKAMK